MTISKSRKSTGSGSVVKRRDKLLSGLRLCGNVQVFFIVVDLMCVIAAIINAIQKPKSPTSMYLGLSFNINLLGTALFLIGVYTNKVECIYAYLFIITLWGLGVSGILIGLKVGFKSEEINIWITVFAFLYVLLNAISAIATVVFIVFLKKATKRLSNSRSRSVSVLTRTDTIIEKPVMLAKRAPTDTTTMTEYTLRFNESVHK